MAAPKKPTKKTTAPGAKPKRAAAAPPAPKTPAPKKPAPKRAATAPSAPKKPRVFAISFASLYPLYLQKVAQKGRTKAELDEVLAWLTGYRGAALERTIDRKVDLEAFFAGAKLNPKADLVTGLVCGVRVEDVEDPLMRKIRVMDKLVDELARGKKLESILRT